MQHEHQLAEAQRRIADLETAFAAAPGDRREALQDRLRLIGQRNSIVAERDSLRQQLAEASAALEKIAIFDKPHRGSLDVDMAETARRALAKLRKEGA